MRLSLWVYMGLWAFRILYTVIISRAILKLFHAKLITANAGYLKVETTPFLFKI